MGVQHGNTEKYSDTTQIAKLAEKLCQVEALFSNELNAINNTNFTNLKTFDSDSKKVFRECQQSVTNQSSLSNRYQNILHECSALIEVTAQANAGPSKMQQTFIDDDIQMGTCEQYIDPISKTPIQNVTKKSSKFELNLIFVSIFQPYINKHCKHIYEYSSITQAIKLNPRLRCPYMGCVNQVRLNVDDLIEDRVTRMKIMQTQQQNESQDLF
jgi:hypothetical protein